MTLFGLHGGLGNMLFALPAIKALSRDREVSLYIEGDNAGSLELFRRCTYAKHVYGPEDSVPNHFKRRICADSPPSKHGPWQRCGWPRPPIPWYPRPEWAQIKKEAYNDELAEDVSDWIDVPKEKQIDFALIPCGKPGEEWARKKWDGWHQLATALESQRFSVEAFGQRDEIGEARLDGWVQGHRGLESVARRLALCRAAVTTDSGIGHLASSLGVPSVFLFTATSPVKGAPLGPHKILSLNLPCAPCQTTPRWNACTDWKCRNIKVDDVLREAVKMIEEEKK